MTGTLDGQTAVVTGGSRGIGRATAARLAAAGARVALLARGQSQLEEAALAIGKDAVAISCDVTRRASITRAAARIVDEWGGAPDLLINAAGAFDLARVDETTPAQFSTMIEANLVAPFVVTRTFLPEMRSRGRGHVVSVGSAADREIYPGNGAYSASKFGLRALHEVLRVELRGSGVRSTLVSPGPTDTALWEAVRTDGGDTVSRDRMLDADAVADAILFAVTRPADVNIDELRLSPA
ncbi:MAG TPA: SDR family oxidoreductase [Gemmatimonadaceae bacterium]|nr:SDR family oxidoreductase [Gemmatimonadaceae bacterium]